MNKNEQLTWCIHHRYKYVSWLEIIHERKRKRKKKWLERNIKIIYGTKFARPRVVEDMSDFNNAQVMIMNGYEEREMGYTYVR